MVSLPENCIIVREALPVLIGPKLRTAAESTHE